MKKLVATIHAPGRLTVLAALLAGLSAPAMAVSPNLVISQLYGAGGNGGSVYRADYVEIFNRGGTAVTATGWTLQYAAAANPWTGKAVLPTFTVEPGQYVLVQMQGSGTAQPALPTPVVVPSSGALNMSGTTGRLALVNDNVTLATITPVTANVVDMIGFGTSATGFEGTGPSPAASTTLALFRANGGCTDTDSNPTDFATGTPAPRTSDSPRNLCGPVVPVAQPIVTSCPASLMRPEGLAASATLSASDTDSVMNGATITSAPVTGISLGSLAVSPNGHSGSATLTADAAMAPGLHAVTVKFTNGDAQEASCTVNVAVGGRASIMEIQGSGATSPFNTLLMTTSGVVTHKVTNGYFLQDAAGDGNPSTSDALFIFTSTAPTVAVGNLVEVQGTITEYRPSGAPRTYTEMKDVIATTVLATGVSVTPTNIDFASNADLPRMESMLVSINNSLTINQTSYLGERGELTLSNGRRETATNRFRPGTPEAIAMAAANATNELTLDDGVFVRPTTTPYLGENNTVRAGDTVTGLVGVIDYGSTGSGAGFKIQPTTPPMISRTNVRLAAPALPAAGLKVASANVLNFFTTFLDGADAWNPTATNKTCTEGTNAPSRLNCRGADNMPEFIRQRDKIVSELVALDADVVGLMEIQNNADTAVDYLVQQLNGRIGFPVYAYVPAPPATGTDAIRVAMIYKPASVALVGGALSDGNSVNHRPPMAQTFKALNGAKFSVIVNHLKSKAGCASSGVNSDRGDGQGCNNGTRVNQANRLAQYFIPEVVNTSGDPDVLVIGDMNAHGFEDPIHILNQAGLVNELERFVRPNEIPYSYVFDGESGYLDHALATASLDSQIAGATEWHTNADEPTVIDYNTDGKSEEGKALWTNDAFRSSDHDPVVVALNLTPTFSDITGTFAYLRTGYSFNRLTNKWSGSVTVGNKTAASVSGPMHVKLSGLPAGVTLDNASGTHMGSPYITVSGPIAGNAKIILPLVFSNPNRATISYTVNVFSGNF